MKKSSILIVIVIVILLSLGYYFNRGLIDYEWYAFNHRKQEMFTKNKALFKQAFMNRVKESGNPQSYIDLGLVEMSIGDYNAAEKNFQVALKRWPNNAAALDQLFTVYKNQKQYDKAESNARRYVGAHPKSSNGYSQFIELYTFYIPDKAGEITQVLNTAFKETGDSQFLVLAATRYAGKNDFAKAAELLNQWLQNKDNTQNREIIQNLYNQYKSKVIK